MAIILFFLRFGISVVFNRGSQSVTTPVADSVFSIVENAICDLQFLKYLWYRILRYHSIHSAFTIHLNPFSEIFFTALTTYKLIVFMARQMFAAGNS